MITPSALTTRIRSLLRRPLSPLELLDAEQQAHRETQAGAAALRTAIETHRAALGTVLPGVADIAMYKVLDATAAGTALLHELHAAHALAEALRVEMDMLRVDSITARIQATLAQQTAQRYGRHLASCATYHAGPGAPCDCGYSAAVAAAAMMEGV